MKIFIRAELFAWAPRVGERVYYRMGGLKSFEVLECWHDGDWLCFLAAPGD
jgi:hypothetical protein